MKIIKEVEIDLSDVKLSELFEVIEDEIMATALLMTPEYQEKMKPYQDDMAAKLMEVYNFLINPQGFIK